MIIIKHMDTVTISKTEYQKLKKQSDAYKKFAGRLFEAVIKDPIGDVAMDFRKTGLYTEGFLRDLEKGLRKSSYI